MEQVEKKVSGGRLMSLDLLRGLDMFLLAVVGPVFEGLCSTWKLAHGGEPLPEALTRQFTHDWSGFTLWDIIMPLFIFMCGAAIPFALPKRLVNGRAGKSYWSHVLGRVALLWGLGLLIQGNLLDFDLKTFSFFSNTLQAIAVGYFATACVLLIPSKRIQIAIPVVLTAFYGLLMHFGGDYSNGGNVTIPLEKWMFTTFLPADNCFVQELVNGTCLYTWFVPSIMFVVMTLCGFHATGILRNREWTPWRKAAVLGIYGGAMLAVGWILAIWVPLIKPIYTVSFTLQAMGYSALALDALYVITDIWMLRRGTGVLLLFGQCALTAYLLSHPPCGAAVEALAQSFMHGAPNLFGESLSPLLTSVCAGVLLTLALYVRRAMKASK